MKDRVCTYCGYIGTPTTQGMGSFFVDAFIWLIFGSLTAMSGLIPLMLLPLAWTVYHLVKYKTTTCPQCENIEMVSMNSRAGRMVLEGASGYPKAWSDHETLENIVIRGPVVQSQDVSVKQTVKHAA